MTEGTWQKKKYFKGVRLLTKTFENHCFTGHIIQQVIQLKSALAAGSSVLVVILCQSPLIKWIFIWKQKDKSAECSSKSNATCHHIKLAFFFAPRGAVIHYKLFHLKQHTLNPLWTCWQCTLCSSDPVLHYPPSPLLPLVSAGSSQGWVISLVL